MSRRDDTRRRMLTSALALLRERGANGVTLDAVLRHSGAPRGSIYHHFPGGRDQLVVEAAALGADGIANIVERGSGDPRAALHDLIVFWKQLLRESDYRSGCPVVALAIDGQERILGAADLTRSTFERMTTGMIRMLCDAGASESQARPIATTSIAALEGAVILCRVQQSTQPLDDVAALLESQLAVLTSASGASRG